MRLPDWSSVTLGKRLAIVGALAVGYAASFVAIHARFGYAPVVLTMVPLLGAALLFGLRGGLIGFACVVPCNLLLLTGVGLDFGPQAPLRIALALVIAVMVGWSRDLNVALWAEALQRQQAEAQLRVTLAAMPDLVFRLRRDGTFIDFHAGTPDDLFVAPERIRGATLAELLPPALAADIASTLDKTLSSGGSEALEYQLQAPRGLQDYEARMVVSGPDEVLTIVRNLTDRKKLERERYEATMKAQLVVADRHAALGTLAAGAAHEINNPLAYVISNLGFLAKRFTQLLAAAPGDGVSLGRAQLAELQDAVSEAANGAERVRVIVRDLKTFSRFDGEAPELVDVRDQLEWALQMAKQQIVERAAVQRDYGEVAPVMANPARLGQIFLNLLVNAAQAIPAGAPAANEIRVVARMAGPGLVQIEIHDSGAGLSAEAKAHLFDPFFTTKEIGVGTGLGLYICHNLVTALGGSITLESEVGRGTAARIQLPARQRSDAKVGTESRAAVPAGRRGRVLVVDDEPSIGSSIRRLLAHEHDVVAVTSATAAFARLDAGERFDVILCDLMMPQVTGMDVYAQLSQREPGQAERLVFLSGGACSEQAEAFLREVRNVRIDKPFDVERLAALVRERVGA